MFGRLCRGVLTHTLTGMFACEQSLQDICQSDRHGPKSFSVFHLILQGTLKPARPGHMTTRIINGCFPGDVEGELCEETGVDIVGALDIIGEVNYCKAL